MAVDERESMIGVDSWGEGSIPGYEHVARMNGGGLPFVDVPGTPLPKNGSRDQMLMRKLADADIPTNRGAKLDYDQSRALYENVRAYFDETDPLMNTERWMGKFVEDRNMTYTDHDGQTYVMKGGVRKLVDGDEQDDQDEPEDDEEERQLKEVEVRIV